MNVLQSFKVACFFLFLLSCADSVKLDGSGKFLVKYYIIGRIKTTEVGGAHPLVIEAVPKNIDVIDNEIRINIYSLDSLKLTYHIKNNIKEVTAPTIGEIITDDFLLKMQLSKNIDSSNIHHLTGINYMIKILPEK